MYPTDKQPIVITEITILEEMEDMSTPHLVKKQISVVRWLQRDMSVPSTPMLAGTRIAPSILIVPQAERCTMATKTRIGNMGAPVPPIRIARDAASFLTNDALQAT